MAPSDAAGAQLREREGRGAPCVVASNAVPKGETAFSEPFYAAVQAQASRRAAPACAHCLQPLGPLALHAAAAARWEQAASPRNGPHPRGGAAQAPALAPLPPLSGAAPQAGDPVPCAAGCGERFCCAACAAVAAAGWHGLLCAGGCDETHPLRDFAAQHAAGARREPLLLAARCVATALAAARDGVATEVAAEPLLALRCEGLIWDVAASAAARRHAARGADGSRAAARRRRRVRERVDDAHQLLCAGLQERSGLDAEQAAPLLDLPFFGRLLAALEACAVPIRVASPLTAYCAALGAAPRDVQAAALEALQPVVEAAARRSGARLGANGELIRAIRGADDAASSPWGGESSDDDDVTPLPSDDHVLPASASAAPAPPLARVATSSVQAASSGADAAEPASPAASTPRTAGNADADEPAVNPAAYGCFGDLLCGGAPGAPAEAPDGPPGLFTGWAADVAQAVSSALCAGGTTVSSVDGAAAQPPGALFAALSCGAGCSAAASEDAAPSAASGVRWGDAPERVAAAVAALAPAVFADVAGVAVGRWASALNHSCVPSCALRAAGGGGLAAVALADVAPGDELTAAHTPPSAPLAVRRAALMRRGVACACARCALESSPEAAEAMLSAELHALARQAQQEGRHSDAEALLWRVIDRAAAAGAPDGDAAHALGACLLARGRFADAHYAWAAGARDAPQHAPLRALAAKVACFWPAPGAPSQLAARDAAVVPTEGDWFTVPLAPPAPGGRRRGPPGDVAVATRTPLLAEDDCARAVAAAEAAAAQRGGWAAERPFTGVPTAELPLHRVPALLAWFNDALRLSIAPLLVAAFPEIGAPGRLRVHDALVVRYSAQSGERFLPVHVDASQYSVTIALNPRADYAGGGTFFEAPRCVVCPDVGHVVGFRGSARHGGEPITAGVRYVVACHCFLGDDDAGDGDGAANNALEDQGF